MAASSRISNVPAESFSSDFGENEKQVQQRESRPQDFFSKLDEAVSNLENLQDDMLVDVPEIASSSSGITNQSSYTPLSDAGTTQAPPLQKPSSDFLAGELPKANPPPSGPQIFDPNSSPNQNPPGSETRPAKADPKVLGNHSGIHGNPPSGHPYPGHELDDEGPSRLLPDELRGHLPGGNPGPSTSANQASDPTSNTSNSQIPISHRSSVIRARIGLLSQDPWLNALIAVGIAAGMSIYPAWEAGRRMHTKIVDPQVIELEEAISRPLAVQDKTLRQPTVIASNIRTNYDKIQQCYYLTWFVLVILLGIPLALIRRKNPLATDLKSTV